MQATYAYRSYPVFALLAQDNPASQPYPSWTVSNGRRADG